MRAAHMTWPEVAEAARANAIALVPVGSTEAHGPHLPLNVDVVIAEEACRRTALALEAQGHGAIIFPAVTYGLTDFAASFSGTISVRADVTTAYLRDILVGIAAHGFSRIAVLNHHVEPAHFKVVHEAVRQAASATNAIIVAPDHRRRPFVDTLGTEFTSGGSHAGAYETSLVLAAAPALVREEVQQALPALDIDLPGRIKAGAKDFHGCGGHDAYFGSPAEATREEGERLFDALASFGAEAILSAQR